MAACARGIRGACRRHPGLHDEALGRTCHGRACPDHPAISMLRRLPRGGSSGHPEQVRVQASPRMTVAFSASRKRQRRGCFRAFAAFRRLVGFQKPIAASSRSNPVLAQPQNMPRTIAVRKAKETMAASTLSLILNSILASFAGMSRLSGAGFAAPIRRVYGRLPGVAKKNRVLQCINIAAQPVVSRLPHRRC